MKGPLILSLALGTIILLTAAAAFAGPWHDGGGGTVPEIDPASLGAAVTLLGGGLAILLGRRRKK